MSQFAIVTGAASGLGLKTVELLLAKGFKVSAWDMQPIPLKSSDLLSFQVDVTDTHSIAKALEKTLETFPKVDVLVSAAGIALLIPTIRRDFIHPLSQFEKVIKVNLIGTFDVCRQVSMHMNGGVIIVVASINAYQGNRGLVAYSASKGAVAGLAMPMSRDLSFKNVRVVCISPGGFETPMIAGTSPENKIRSSKAVALNRVGQPEEFAHAVMFAIENKYLNGCNLGLDGGLVNPNL